MDVSGHPRHSRTPPRGDLQHWSLTPRARALLALETAELQRVLPEVFGRHLLQIGSWIGGDALLGSAETLHRAVLGTVIDGSVSALVEPERLPLPEKSVDAVILPHTLEYAASSHMVLREVARVLNDRGRLFLLGFSPWSLWAWRRRLGLAPRGYPTMSRYYGCSRVGDWLQLLDFDIVDVRRFGVGFPWLAPRSSTQPWTPGRLLAPFAENYLIVARKRVLPVNLIGRAQRAQVKSLVGVALPTASRQIDSKPGASS